MKRAISIIVLSLLLFLGSSLSFAPWSLSVLAQEVEKEVIPTPAQTRVIFFVNPSADPVDRLTMGDVIIDL